MLSETLETFETPKILPETPKESLSNAPLMNGSKIEAKPFNIENLDLYVKGKKATAFQLGGNPGKSTDKNSRRLGLAIRSAKKFQKLEVICPYW